MTTAPRGCTVADAVTDWLTYGLGNHSEGTRQKCTYLTNGHVIPALGARKLVDLSADDVDKWLAAKAELSTSSLRNVLSILKRSIDRAQARDKVRRTSYCSRSSRPGRRGGPRRL